MRRLAQPGVEPKPAGEIYAAADLDQNGQIDQRDVDRLFSWAQAGSVATPALSFQAYLPCNFKQFFVASSQSRAAPLRFAFSHTKQRSLVDDSNPAGRPRPRSPPAPVDLALKIGDFTLRGIGAAAFGTIVLYQLWRDRAET